MIKKWTFFTIIGMIMITGMILLNSCRNNHTHSQADLGASNSISTEENAGLSHETGHSHSHHTDGAPGNQLKSLPPQTIVALDLNEKKQLQIKTVAVEEKSLQSILKAMGKVIAPIEGKAMVGYAFPGRIIQFKAPLGQWVKKGSPLVTLECEDVGHAKSEYLKAFTEFQFAHHNFQREERLFNKDIGAKKDFIETRAQLDISSSNLESAEKRLMVMGFSKTQIHELTQTKDINPLVMINAPIEGRIIQIDSSLGAMIEPSTVIMILLNPSHLCIDAEIFEKDLASIKIDQEVKITVPAYPAETFIGRISYIGDIVHPETRTITVKTNVPNKEFKLKPGMFADIGIRLDRGEKALSIPIEAVLDHFDQKIVFTQEADSFVCKVVEVGATFNGSIEIKEGLNIGETVVIEGNYQLKSKLYEQNLHQAHVH